jgi:hypothetical protein
MTDARLGIADGGTSADATGNSSTTMLFVEDCSSEICTLAGVWTGLLARSVALHNPRWRHEQGRY